MDIQNLLLSNIRMSINLTFPMVLLQLNLDDFRKIISRCNMLRGSDTSWCPNLAFRVVFWWWKFTRAYTSELLQLKHISCRLIMEVKINGFIQKSNLVKWFFRRLRCGEIWNAWSMFQWLSNFFRQMKSNDSWLCESTLMSWI